MMYISTVSFYPVKGLEFMTKPRIRNNLWWAIPTIAILIMSSLILLSPGGSVDVIGGAYHVYCAEGTASQPAEIISSKGSPDLIGVCEDYAPYIYMVPEILPQANFCWYYQYFQRLLLWFLCANHGRH